jgi:hypothetical protein
VWLSGSCGHFGIFIIFQCLKLVESSKSPNMWVASAKWTWLAIGCLLECSVMSSSVWSAQDSLRWLDCRWWLFDFFFFASHISNVYHCLICFLLFNLSPRSINFLFHSFFICISFYYFQFSHLIATSHMFGFSFQPSFLKFFTFVLDTFVEVSFLSISFFNQIFCCFIFFSWTFILLIFFSFY